MSVRAGTSLGKTGVGLSSITHPGVLSGGGQGVGLVSLPEGPGTAKEFCDAGGTIQQYMVLMGQYYAACHVACRTESSVALSMASSAEPIKPVSKVKKAVGKMPWVRASAEKLRAMKAKSWRTVSTESVAPKVAAPVMGLREFSVRLQSKEDTVRQAGSGHCYLYAIKAESAESARKLCGSRPTLLKLMQLPGDMFEDHAYLGTLPVRFSETELDVLPVGEPDSKFLTVCRAMSSSVDSPFMREMDIYEPSRMDVVHRPGYRVGGPVDKVFECVVSRVRGASVLGCHGSDLSVCVTEQVPEGGVKSGALVPIKLLNFKGGVFLDARVCGEDERIFLGPVPNPSLRLAVSVRVTPDREIVTWVPRVEEARVFVPGRSGRFTCELYRDFPVHCVKGQQVHEFALPQPSILKMAVTQDLESLLVDGACGFTPVGVDICGARLVLQANVLDEPVEVDLGDVFSFAEKGIAKILVTESGFTVT